MDEVIIDKRDAVIEEEKVSTIVEDESPRSPIKVDEAAVSIKEETLTTQVR